MKYRDTILKRIEIDGECWMWKGPKHTKGYGRLRIGSKKTGKWARVHRLMFEECVGPIGEGLMVCHRCDRPGCVNPAHLFLGTQTDNMADKVLKGRASKKIRREYAEDIRAQFRDLTARLAAKYGVGEPTIRLIASGKAWAEPVAHIREADRP